MKAQIKITVAVIVASLLCGCKPSASVSKNDGIATPTNVLALPVQPVTTSTELNGVISAFYFFKGIPWDALKKTEFESTNEFLSRIQTISPPASPIWIAVDTNAVSLEYDAESKVCQAFITHPLFVTGGQTPAYRLTVYTVRAMNGEINEAKVVDNFELTIQNPLPAELTYANGIKLVAPISGSRAKELFESGNLRVLLKIEVNSLTNAQQFIEYKHSDDFGPWVDMAQDVPVDLLGAKLINIASGEVISSWGNLTPK
ncbi:MAG: hypothetical protein ACLP2Y_16860 [Limisphaerales bacterium]